MPTNPRIRVPIFLAIIVALCTLTGCGERAADGATASLTALQAAVATDTDAQSATAVQLSPELVDLIRVRAQTREADTASANPMLADLAAEIEAAGPRSLPIDVAHARASEGMGLLLVERARVGGVEMRGMELMALSQTVIECAADDLTTAATIARAMVLGLDPAQLQQGGQISELHSVPHELGSVVRRDPAISSERSSEIQSAMSAHRAAFEAWFDRQ